MKIAKYTETDEQKDVQVQASKDRIKIISQLQL